LLTREQILAFIETAFRASLRLNEGRVTRFCAVAAAPKEFVSPVVFEAPVPYDEPQIAKLAPAVPEGGCIGVSIQGDELQMWGFACSRVGSWADVVTVDVWEPGTVRVGVGPFQPFAVINGRSNPIIAGSPIILADYLRRVLRKALPADDILETQAVWRECLALKDLARMIVAGGRGGTVLIVPSETGTWSESLNPFTYRFASPVTKIRDSIRLELNEAQAQGETVQRLSAMELDEDLRNSIMVAVNPRSGNIERGVRAVASLAAVDGAIVLTRDLRLLGFGAKIVAGGDAAPRVCMFRPEPGSQKVVSSPLEDLGGTRHQSAARFTDRNRDTVGLVISQDRHLSVMHWDEAIGSVSVLRNAEWWV
jgi:hypothetical protein